MSKSDTPRTDAAILNGGPEVECAKLERELSEALEIIKALMPWVHVLSGCPCSECTAYRKARALLERHGK